MILRATTLLLILLFSANAFGQTYSSIISDKEIYDFLNWMTSDENEENGKPTSKPKQIGYRITSWDSANFSMPDSAQEKDTYSNFSNPYLFGDGEKTNTFFKQQDRLFLFQQFISIHDSIWHRPFVNSIWTDDKYEERPSRYYYSIPLFSVDKKYVIVEKVYHCGMFCGSGGYFVYRTTSYGTWEYVTTIRASVY